MWSLPQRKVHVFLPHSSRVGSVAGPTRDEHEANAGGAREPFFVWIESVKTYSEIFNSFVWASYAVLSPLHCSPKSLVDNSLFSCGAVHQTFWWRMQHFGEQRTSPYSAHPSVPQVEYERTAFLPILSKKSHKIQSRRPETCQKIIFFAE